MPASNSFGLECLDNSSLYASNNASAYLGCCTIDPGTTDDGLCPDSKIRPATFDLDAYSKILSQDCMGHDTNVLWYTCSDTAPPFLGCCGIDPCAKGSCPQSALKPARLSSNARNASSFLQGVFTIPTKTTLRTSSTTTAVLSKTASASNGASAPSTSAPPATSDDSGHRRVAPTAAAGIAIVITAGVLVLFSLAFWWVKRRRASAKRNAFIAAAISPMGLNNNTTILSTPHCLYSPSSSHQSKSSLSPASQHHANESNGSPLPPAYYTTAKRSDAPAELPGNLRFELVGDSPRSTHRR